VCVADCCKQRHAVGEQPNLALKACVKASAEPKPTSRRFEVRQAGLCQQARRSYFASSAAQVAAECFSGQRPRTIDGNEKAKSAQPTGQRLEVEELVEMQIDVSVTRCMRST